MSDNAVMGKRELEKTFGKKPAIALRFKDSSREGEAHDAPCKSF